MKVSIEKEPLRKLERNTQSWNVAALFDFKCRLNINFCKKKKKVLPPRGGLFLLTLLC